MLHNHARERAQPDKAAAAPGFEAKRVILLVLTASVIAALMVSACSRGKRHTNHGLSKRVVALGEPVPKGGGRYKVGNPYKVGGRWFRPQEQPGYDRVGVASWYGEMFHGRYTANGEIYDMNALTAAHPTLPLPSYVRVMNLRNGRALVLRVNDRGPYAHDRIIDLSRRSARALDFERAGTARVRVQYLGRAPLNGDDSLERRVFASQSWARLASLENSAKPGASTIRVAQGSNEEFQADPMVVGSIDAAKASPADAEWTTGASPARVPELPKQERNVFVQAASFQRQDYAELLRGKLAGLGNVRILPTGVAGRTYYRVRLDPYPERHEADEALRAVVSLGVNDARIVQN